MGISTSLFTLIYRVLSVVGRGWAGVGAGEARVLADEVFGSGQKDLFRGALSTGFVALQEGFGEITLLTALE